jgi:transglutaminase-like putative cysteine protease
MAASVRAGAAKVVRDPGQRIGVRSVLRVWPWHVDCERAKQERVPFCNTSMKFKISCELEYSLNGPATFLFALKCIETGGQKILRESLTTSPFVMVDEFNLAGGMNRFSRLATFNSGNLSLFYEADVSTSVRIVGREAIWPDPLKALAPEAIPFLLPSRYCPSDQMRRQALTLFGHLESQYEIATGVSDWIHDNITYVVGSSGESSSALDTMEQRQGVCRDFAHLGITMCRALNVPARYATCYAYRLHPPDFHACFEVFIGGWWYVFDPTRLAPLNGLVRIATGRDATETAVCTIFGDPQLLRSVVSCDLLDPEFDALTHGDLNSRGEALALL